MGLGFVNIENELSYQSKFGIPNVDYGTIITLKNVPLDFQYQTAESVDSFLAVKLDAFGMASENIILSTSLINSTGTQHICDGLTDYSSDLECGNYYFLVNSKYQSETFRVLTQLTEGTSNQEPISVSGLGFVNLEYENPFKDKFGSPVLGFGNQFSENSSILSFIYRATDAVSSFDLIELDNLGNEIGTTSLNTSLISSDGNYHESTQGDYNFSGGRYIFRVNDKYESDVFCIAELENVETGDALLLESGDFLLLETGFKLLLE